MAIWRQWWADAINKPAGDGPFSAAALAESRHRIWDNMAAMQDAWWTLWRASFTAPWTSMPWPPAGQILPPDEAPLAERPEQPVALKAPRQSAHNRAVPKTRAHAKRLRHP